MRRPPAAAVVLTVVLALVATACSGGADDAGRDGASTSTTTAAQSQAARVGPNGFTPKPIHWTDCGSDECATVEVPLDYSTPAGRTTHLAVLRVPATGARRGALFVNPGGPGGSATEFAAELPLILPSSITEHFDVVGVDPRGIGGSLPFDCEVDYTDVYRVDPRVDTPAERDALLTNARDLARACKAHAGDVLAHVGTRNDARDLDAVRAAMGDAQLSYFGGSYGTVIGQVYAELFPSHVKAMVLDGVVDLGASGLDVATEQAAGFETALDRFVAHCADTGTCKNKDPLKAIEQVRTLAERPGGIPADGDARSAGPGEVNLGLGQALYSEALWSDLDKAVYAALHGDGSGMVALADQYLGGSDYDVYFAVSCIDFAWPSGNPDAFLAAAAAAGAASPPFGEAIVSDYLRCVDWPVPPDPLTPVTAPGTPPILVISTTGDPATPYAAGVAVAKRLSKGVLITNEGEGHGALTEGSACISALVAAYLVDDSVPRDGTTCES